MDRSAPLAVTDFVMILPVEPRPIASGRNLPARHAFHFPAFADNTEEGFTTETSLARIADSEIFVLAQVGCGV